MRDLRACPRSPHRDALPPLRRARAGAACSLARVVAQLRPRPPASLAQLALAWTLRDPRVTSTLIGTSSVSQLEQNVAAVDGLELKPDKLIEIDRYVTDSGINLRAWSSAG